MNQVGGSLNSTRCGNSCDSKNGSQMWIGFLGALIAIALFGSNFIPVKKYDTGDGMYVCVSSLCCVCLQIRVYCA